MNSFLVRFEKMLYYLGVSAYKLAKEIGVSETAIANIRAGKTKPGYSLIIKLSNKYKAININWLLTGMGEMMLEEHQQKTIQSTVDDYEKTHGIPDNLLLANLKEAISTKNRAITSLKRINEQLQKDVAQLKEDDQKSKKKIKELEKELSKLRK